MNANANQDKPICVMLIEDHPEYRDVVEIALSKENDFQMVGTFGAAEIAQRSLQSNAQERPDVILLDLNLPGISGLEALASFKTTVPDVKVIVLTQSNQESDIIRAISLGASGYLLKSAKVSKIVEGIRNVMIGHATMDSSVAKFISKKLQTIVPQKGAQRILSPRELEVLHLLGEGLIKKEIAGKLGLSTSTINTHVVHIFGKLNVQNAPSAIAKAFRLGLFDLD